MPSAVRFSNRAESDLLAIGAYTLRNWGRAQAQRYLDEIETACERISLNPKLGRVSDHIRAGLRRMELGSHVLFYREVKDGILISRILHQNMLPERHPFEDSTD